MTKWCVTSNYKFCMGHKVETAAQPRIFGLDVMRAAAILLVVFWHSYDAITYLAPGFVMPFFLDGVDLFFVLSGYLIGGILLKVLAKTEVPIRQRLIKFWRRRFFRTLPNYYLFLLVNIAIVWLGLGKGLLNHNVTAYFALLHNLWKPFSLFYWESWSLVTEVWFYLLFPLGLIGCLSLLGWTIRKSFVVTSIVFILVPTSLRILASPAIDSMQEMVVGVREVAMMRIDSVVFGVLAVLLATYYPQRWKSFRWPLLVLGMAGTCVVASFYGEAHLVYSTTWYYSLSALSMACLLPLMSAWTREPRWGRVITWLSHISYALFLVHLPVRYVLERWYDPFTPLAGWLQLIGYWLVCTGLAWLVYRYYELPLMNLRERKAAKA